MAGIIMEKAPSVKATRNEVISEVRILCFKRFILADYILRMVLLQGKTAPYLFRGSLRLEDWGFGLTSYFT
jgi:hypothetical protein